MIANETDLRALIDAGTPESAVLEFKAAAAISNAKEIAKDVSAMANSAGGIIIYGLTETDNKPDQIDPITEKKLSREYLDQVITNGIRPLVKFRTEPIPIGGGYVYAVHIEPGETAHMALEQNRYYKRYNFIASPMDDYEVRDVMNRRKHPKIVLDFRRDDKNIFVRLRNDGPLYAQYIRCQIEFPRGTLENVPEQTHVKRGDLRYVQLVLDNSKHGILHRGLSLPWVVFPMTDFQANELIFRMRPTVIYPIYWTVYADNADADEQSIELPKIQRRAYDEISIPGFDPNSGF